MYYVYFNLFNNVFFCVNKCIILILECLKFHYQILGLARDPEELLAYVTENTDLNCELKWKCKICGKPGLNRRDIRNHVESLHFPDMFAYQCKICNMTMKSRKALDNHKYRKHPKDQHNN